MQNRRTAIEKIQCHSVTSNNWKYMKITRIWDMWIDMFGLPHSLQKLEIGFSGVQINVLHVQQVVFISVFIFILSSDVHILKDFSFLCICENS